MRSCKCPPAGLSDRFGARATLASYVALWSLTTLCTGLRVWPDVDSICCGSCLAFFRQALPCRGRGTQALAAAFRAAPRPMVRSPWAGGWACVLAFAAHAAADVLSSPRPWAGPAVFGGPCSWSMECLAWSGRRSFGGVIAIGREIIQAAIRRRSNLLSTAPCRYRTAAERLSLMPLISDSNVWVL